MLSAAGIKQKKKKEKDELKIEEEAKATDTGEEKVVKNPPPPPPLPGRFMLQCVSLPWLFLSHLYILIDHCQECSMQNGVEHGSC